MNAIIKENTAQSAAVAYRKWEKEMSAIIQENTGDGWVAKMAGTRAECRASIKKLRQWAKEDGDTTTKYKLVAAVIVPL